YGWSAVNHGSIIDNNVATAFTIGDGDFNSYMFLDFIWGVPPSQRAKIVAANPVTAAGLNSALGQGWSVRYRDATSGTDNHLASDNQLGQIHAGVVTTRDKTCLDHFGPLAAGGIFGAGNPLMAGSDCPQTWGALGWQGRRPIPGDVYLSAAQASPATFSFDFWTFPEGDPDGSGKLDRQFGSFQTYGSFNDYSKDELCGTASTRTYGNVIRAAQPACPAVAPTKPGYPLGLEVRNDMFAFGIPALADVTFYQMTVANNTAELYGSGVDYDSLYIGLMPVAYGDTQRNMVYYQTDLSAMIHTGVCSHQTVPVCNGAQTVADLRTSDVIPPAGFPPYGLGATALIMLKSPIGDLRNKLFSTTSSPFFAIRASVNPDLLGDTITFQHGHMCGFRACARTTFATSDQLTDHMQRQFGMISSTELNVLGTRTLADLNNTAGQILWHTLRSAEFDAGNLPSIGTGPSQFPQVQGFNRYIPGAAVFDYNHDNIADTLYYDTCSSKTGGCVGLFSDTMPHTGGPSRRFLNGYSNTAGVMTVGPISLAAGDTTSFVFAIAAACCGAGNGDSLALMTKVNSTINHYLNFYLGPEPLPKDTIVAVEVIGGNQDVSQVTLRFTQTAENSVDPFLLNQAASFAAAPAGTADARLVQLNPFLIDSLLAYAQQFGTAAGAFDAIGNFDKLFIFKSCDGGNTFTNTADCQPSPATGGPFATLGWLPYATIERAPDGSLQNSFTDPNVNGGTTYTYVVIGQTRGVTLSLLTGDAVGTSGGNTFCTANCQIQRITFAPALFNPLTTSGSNVAIVYVPASLQAGGQAPLVTVQTIAGPVPASRVIVTTAANRPVAGTYSVTFYDSVIVTVFDTLDASGSTRVFTSTTVQGYRGGAATPAKTSTALGGVGLNGGTLVKDSSFQQAPGTRIRRTRVYRFTGLTAILENTTTNTPVLVTNRLNATATPEDFFSSSAFPGFLLGFQTATDLAFNAERGEVFLAAKGGQPIAPLVIPFVRYQSSTNAAGAQGGLYNFDWQANPFGPGEPFRLGDPATVQAEVTASLNSRAVAQTGVVDAAAATAIGTTVANLVAVKLPFAITNESFNRPVKVAMRKRAADRILLGTGQDTVTVTIPSDVWVPGDALIFLEDHDGNAATPDVVTLSSIVLGCPTVGTRLSCNPIALLTRGATNYITTKPGTQQSVLFNPKLTTAQQFTFTVVPQRSGTQLAGACGADTTSTPDATICAEVKASIKDVRVVPNPYVVFSNYVNPRRNADINRPLMFTHVPARGSIKIYTVSGQFVQQLSWTEADLNDTGDLIFDLRSREGNLLAGGLYLFMVTGTDQNGTDLGRHMGKFVIIR
ncbi:MAG: hypothetical protein ABR543_07290, partial [Gemmatimonadaceae bacterium]